MEVCYIIHLQVIPLGPSCTASHLIELRQSSANFSVICAQQSLYYATINSTNHIILGGLKIYSEYDNDDHSAVIIEVDGQLNTVTYLVDSWVDVYVDGSGSTLALPSNIDCQNKPKPVLYRVPEQEAFALHCTTSDGPTLYLVKVPIDSESRAPSLQANGHPYFSPDGTYIVIVNSSVATVYVTKEMEGNGQPVTFKSKIVKLNFLNEYHMLVLMRNGHSIVNLRIASEPRNIQGGPPFLYTWASSVNNYIYIVENNGVYRIRVVNETSTKATYESKGIAEQPQSLMYIRNFKSPANSEPYFHTPSGNKSNVTTIGSSVASVIIVLSLVGFSILLFIFLKKRKWLPFNVRGVLPLEVQNRDRGAVPIENRGNIMFRWMSTPSTTTEDTLTDSTLSLPPSDTSRSPSAADTPPQTPPTADTPQPPNTSFQHPPNETLPNNLTLEEPQEATATGREVDDTLIESSDDESDQTPQSPLIPDPRESYSISATNLSSLFPPPQQVMDGPIIEDEPIVERFAGLVSASQDRSESQTMTGIEENIN